MTAITEPRSARDVVERLAAALGPGPVERRETHCSCVLLTGTRAYKLKKPVVLDFLDYGTPERRRAMCRAEVELNRRAAPRIYLGVRAVVPAGEGVALAAEDAPGALEYVVEMVRFDEQRTLAALLSRDEGTAAVVERVGRKLARFHESCPVVRPRSGAEPVKRTLDDNFATLATLLADDAPARSRLVTAQRFAARFLDARWGELDARAGAGRVRDGHGDLRAEHLVLGDRVEIVDAIEFDPALRQIDAGLDLAFLVMDLHAQGRSDLATGLVAAYRAAGGDPGDDPLIAFFAAYRAQVRAKVALLRALQLGPEAGAIARAEAADLLALGDRLCWAARGPLVLAVAGASATGKTTLGRALGAASGLPVFSSDVIRKRLLGLAPTARAPQSAYSPDVNAATYRELGRLACGAGTGAIVDATFRLRSERDAFRSGLATAGGRLAFVECRVPRPVLEQRAAARLADPGRISDATPAIAVAQLSAFEPLDEVPPDTHIAVRTDQDSERCVAEISDRLDHGLPR